MEPLPQDVLREIVRRIGNRNYRQLSSFIFSGRDGRDAAYADNVLRDANLREFMNTPSKANVGSIYRPIFVRCLHAGNKTAQYIEGLRIALMEGFNEESIELLRKAENQIEHAHFAIGIFTILSGNLEMGKAILEPTRQKYQNNISALRHFGERFVSQVYDIGGPYRRPYRHTFIVRGEEVPGCTVCTYVSTCPHCFWFAYAIRVNLVC